MTGNRNQQVLCWKVVEAPGIEADSSQLPITAQQQSGTIGTDADSAGVSGRTPKCAIVHRAETESSEAYELSNVVETALAKALVLAAKAKRWDVVAQIAESCSGGTAVVLHGRPRYSLSVRRKCEAIAPRSRVRTRRELSPLFLDPRPVMVTVEDRIECRRPRPEPCTPGRFLQTSTCSIACTPLT